MKIIRFEGNREATYGILEDDNVFRLTGSLTREFEKGDWICGIGDVRLLPPIKPGTIIGVGSNYYGLLKQMDMEVPKEPSLFLKASSCVIGPRENIILPVSSNDVLFEGELAVILKQYAEHVSVENALDYVLGFTCANDLTIPDITDRFPTRNKCFYSSCPLGPHIVTSINCDNLNIKTRLNGEIISDGSTKDMVFGIEQLISYITSFMPLEPLDVILTGTAGRSRKLSNGDIVEVEIEKIGVLRNKVLQGS